MIPAVKVLKETGEYLRVGTVNVDFGNIPPEFHSAVKKLPLGENGVELSFDIAGNKTEGYEITLRNSGIEFVCAVKAICLLAELCGKKENYGIRNIVDAHEFINEYSELWLSKNKKSELHEIIKIFEEMNK